MKVDQRNARAGGDVVAGDKNTYYISDPALADEKISYELRLLRNRRWFAETDQIEEASRLAALCTEGILAGSSVNLRHIALAWCSRILAGEDDPLEAEKVLAEAKKIGKSEELSIAEAFIASKREGKSAALSILAGIDTPTSKTASLMIVTNHSDNQNAIKWLAKAGIKSEDLDAEGKGFLINVQIDVGDWEGAAVTIKSCKNQDFIEHPGLLLSHAYYELLSIMPTEYRQMVREYLPFELSDFELASDDISLESHVKAHELFTQAAKILSELDLPKISEIADSYALWLGLRHPVLREDARKRLREGLSGPVLPIKLVHFAIKFGEPINIKAAEEEITRQVTRHGKATLDTSLARLSIALKQDTRMDVAKYIDRYREEIEQHISHYLIASIEIEVFSKSGRPDLAQAVLIDLSRRTNISEEQKEKLEKFISESTEEDQVSVYRRRYEESESITDLKILIEILYDQREWDLLSKYSELMFSKTKSQISAERYTLALLQTGKDKIIINFLDTNLNLCKHSNFMRIIYCWALYRNGEILRAHSVLNTISIEKDFDNYYALRRNIAITSGDWNELSQIVADEAANIQDRTAKQLLQAAHLGYQIKVSPSLARDLLFAAADKGQDDPKVLASAYFLATNAGLEGAPDVYTWLHRAVELSGDDGPIYQASLSDLLEKKPEWDQQQEKIGKLLKRGEIPMFMAARSLNRTLINMVLFPYLYNQQSDDPRQRIVIPAFSGRRDKIDFGSPEVLGLDATALLTLGGLGLLDVLIKLGCEIRIPHSTMLWMFEERHRAAFHQVSRIRQAQEVQDLLAENKISVFSPTCSAPAELRAQIGDELATMIAQAQIEDAENDAQHLVVRSAPVHRLGSFLDEEVNLEKYHDVLVSCQNVVNKLSEMGRITNLSAKRSLSYLMLNEKRWPNEKHIENNAVLYLDSLSVTYLLSCDLIDDINRAGFKIYVSSDCLDEAQNLLNYQRVSNRAEVILEEIRIFLNKGIMNETIKLGPVRQTEDSIDNYEIHNDPTFEVLLFGDICDVVVIDDRCINQHVYVKNDDKNVCHLITSLDLLNYCSENDYIDNNLRYEAMARLRRGGYIFVDIGLNEIYKEIIKCDVQDGKLIETAELRAIRENILISRFTSYLRSTDEIKWLDKLLTKFIKTLWRIWVEGEKVDFIIARSEWLLPHLDVCGWLHCFPYDQAKQILYEGRASLLSKIFNVPPELDDVMRKQYLEWVDNRIAIDVKRKTPKLFNEIVENYKRITLDSLDIDIFSEENLDD